MRALIWCLPFLRLCRLFLIRFYPNWKHLIPFFQYVMGGYNLRKRVNLLPNFPPHVASSESPTVTRKHFCPAAPSSNLFHAALLRLLFRQTKATTTPIFQLIKKLWFLILYIGYVPSSSIHSILENMHVWRSQKVRFRPLGDFL